MGRIVGKPNSSSSGSGLRGKDLISFKDLSKGQVISILNESESMLRALTRRAKLEYLENRIMATAFFEPSTRTRLSFESAMQRLGGGVIGFSDVNTTSSVKGESLADTIRVVASYADIIVLRHPKAGAALEAAEYSDVPVINAGDGSAEHPTQALYDLFTIKMQKRRLSGMSVAIVGDLKNARTVHSFAYAVAMFKNNIKFIAPEQLQASGEMVEDLEDNYGIEIEKSDSLDEAKEADVIYIPRMQKERFLDPEEYKRFANYYTINKKFLSKANDDIIVMSPLPRLGELPVEIDNLKSSVYFKQVAYGVPVRMAVLKLILGG